MSLRISKSAKNILLINGIHREWGARPIRRIIQDEIENVISFKYLNGEIKENSIIYISGKGSQLIFKSKCSKEKTKSKSL
jgi:ATP-dependent Clp protease ATP-binding subunit ClpA